MFYFRDSLARIAGPKVKQRRDRLLLAGGVKGGADGNVEHLEVPVAKVTVISKEVDRSEDVERDLAGLEEIPHRVESPTLDRQHRESLVFGEVLTPEAHREDGSFRGGDSHLGEREQTRGEEGIITIYGHEHRWEAAIPTLPACASERAPTS
jgi:hypothetical protein